MNGLSYDSGGRLLVDDVDGITDSCNGLPFTATGAVAVATGGMAVFPGTRGFMFDGGRLAVADLPGLARGRRRAGVGIFFLGAVLGAVVGWLAG